MKLTMKHVVSTITLSLLFSGSFAPVMAANEKPELASAAAPSRAGIAGVSSPDPWKAMIFEIAVNDPPRFQRMITNNKERIAQLRAELAAMGPANPERSTHEKMIENQLKLENELSEMQSASTFAHSNV